MNIKRCPRCLSCMGSDFIGPVCNVCDYRPSSLSTLIGWVMVLFILSLMTIKDASASQEATEVTCDTELDCLAQVIYFEARGEIKAGQVAVAQVVLNRVHSPKFPNTIKEVVWQPYQFSYTNDGLHERMVDVAAKAKAYNVAHFVLDYGQYFDSMEGADHYFAHKLVDPSWKHGMMFIARVGDHSFYRSK